MEEEEGIDPSQSLSLTTRNGKRECFEGASLEQDVETKKEKSLSFGEKLQDPVYKEKFIYSMCMAVSFVAQGMNTGQHGPTFMDLQIITKTDLETASTLFTGGNAGYLVGSMLVGLIWNKMNTPMLVFVMTLCLGLTNILQPYCTQIEIMVVIRFASATFAGGLDTGLNSEHMTLWGSDANDLLQLLQFSISFGGVISPLFAEPFLAEKMEQETVNGTTNVTFHHNTTGFQSHGETNVHYVFLITGVFTILTACPFLVIYFRRGEKSRQEVKNRKFRQRNVPFPVMILLLCGLCMFYFTYSCVHDTFFSFLMTFLVEEYDSVSKSKGAFVTAIAWASFAVASFMMIFVAKILSAVQILLILTTAMVVSFTSFSVFAHFGIVNALIVLSAVASLPFSGVFPAGFSWTEREMFPVTGIISSCFFVSSSLGAMVNPLILGNLMEERTNMWFCYLLLIETFIMYFILIILLIFSRQFVDKKYGSLASFLNKARDVEIEIDLSNGVES